MKMQSPKSHRQLDNHVGATKKSGTVTAPGLYKNSSVGVKQDKNYTVRPNSNKSENNSPKHERTERKSERRMEYGK